MLRWVTALGLSALGSVGGLVVASVLLLVRSDVRAKAVPWLVSYAVGTLLGAALLGLLPEALETLPPRVAATSLLVGVLAFFAVEKLVLWHHWHDDSAETVSPLSHMMIAGDSLHNLLGGVAVAGAFIVDIRLGITTWIVAAAHEVPQELGKYGVLLHGGWSYGKALLVSLASSLTFLVGGLFAYLVSVQIDVAFLVPFAAGNFIYIAASDLVPEVNKHHRLSVNVMHFAAFAAGIALLLMIKAVAGR